MFIFCRRALRSFCYLRFLPALGLLLTPVSVAAQSLSLDDAIALAIENDPWLENSRLQQQAIVHMADAQDRFPDTRVGLSLANLPVNSWELSQEPMSQISVNLSQMFPRGDTLKLTKQKRLAESKKYPFERQDREAWVRYTVTQLWLDAALAVKNQQLLENKKQLVEQITEVSTAEYASSVRARRQQDLVALEIDAVKISDNLLTWQQKLKAAEAALENWIQQDLALAKLQDFPEINQFTKKEYSISTAFDALTGHPAIVALDQAIEAAGSDVSLARQQYKPQWGVNASYGYRRDARDGTSRADFFSAGVMVDVPLFAGNSKSEAVSAAVAQTEAIKTQKRLMLKNMREQVQTAQAQLQVLKQRKQLYQDQLLLQSERQVDIARSAYTNDDAEFSSVLRADLAQLDIQLTALAVENEILKKQAYINYYLTAATYPAEER